MASPSATVLCTAAISFRLAPNMAVLFFLAAALLATPTRSSSSSNDTGRQHPTLTLCSGHSPAVVTTSSEVTITRFLAAVCAGAYGGVAHMSHNMSSYVAAENRTMYGVAQCRTDVSASDCAACLSAASKLIVAGPGTACAASARRLLPPLLGPRGRGPIPRGRVHGDRVQREPHAAAVAARGRQSGGEAPPRRREEDYGEQPHVQQRRCRRHWGCGVRRRPFLRTHAVRRRRLVRRLPALPPRRPRGGGQGVQRQRGDAGAAAQLHGQVRELPLLQHRVPGPAIARGRVEKQRAGRI